MTLSLYREQAQRDYQLLRTTKEQNILLAQLVNAQAIENLALNARVLTMVGAKETEIKSTAGAELKRATDRYKIAMNAITEGCIAKLEAQYEGMLQNVTPYDTEDAIRTPVKLTELLETLELTNTMLVSEKSKLRVHLFFMPIKYRQEIETMQKTDNQLYRGQRRVPRSISPRDSENHGGQIKFVEAPRAHEMTRHLHDCEYAGIQEIRAGVREATKLKKNLYSNVIPFKSETIDAPPLLPKREAAPRPDSGKGKAALRSSQYNAEQGLSTRRKLDPRDDHDRRDWIPPDKRMVQRNPSPQRNPSHNRYIDSDGTVYPGDPERDRSTNSGPFLDKNFRERYDNSRDKNMSSDRSRDPRPRDAQQDLPYRNRRAQSPTKGRGAKGAKGSRAPSTASAFPRFQDMPIPILTRSQALRHLKIEKPLPPPTESEARDITNEELAKLIRKPSQTMSSSAPS
jgi:hypothetical protein